MDAVDRAALSLPFGPDDEVSAQERARLLGRYGRHFVAGETLFQEGTGALEAFLLQEGRVRLLKRIAMSDRSIAVVKPGDLFGEGALLEGLTYGSTAVALTDGVVLALDRLHIAGERIAIPDVEALRRLYALLGAQDELAG